MRTFLEISIMLLVNDSYDGKGNIIQTGKTFSAKKGRLSSREYLILFLGTFAVVSSKLS